MIRTSYLERVLDPDQFQLTVDRMLEKTREVYNHTPFDVIAFSGASGAAIAFIIGFMMNFPLVMVRRRHDGSHHVGDRTVTDEEYRILNKGTKLRYMEGETDFERFLIVDDQIDTGSTIELITGTIKEHNPSAKCVGTILYGWNYVAGMISDPLAPRWYLDDPETFPVYFGGYADMRNTK